MGQRAVKPAPRIAAIAASGILIAIACGDGRGGDGSDGEAGAKAGSSGGGSGSGGRVGAEAGSSGTAGRSSGAAGAAGPAGVGGAAAGRGGAAGGGGSGSRGGDAGSADAGGAGGGSAADVPADLLDLGDWKVTLPVAEASGTSPREVTQPALRTFALDPYFRLTPALDGVQFRAHAGGVTTSNSGYPRSELREMTDGGANNASWSTSSGTHAMTITQAITQLPVAKPHVVAGQIHDAEDDVVMIRLEDERLFVEGGGDDLGLLDANYTLGTSFTVKLVAADGQIRVFYNDLVTPKVTVSRATTGCYFKAGVYTQSNVDRGDAPDTYGEVVITSLAVEHR